MRMIKSIRTYIGKTLKATVVLTAAFALVGGGLMFCCMSKTAQASTAVPKMSGHCHQGRSAQHQTDHSKTCDCCKVKPGDSDTLVKLFDIVPSLVKNFHAFVAVDALAYLPQVRLSHLAYTGPPRANASLPIYLQNSCLRL
jgi:hypothetical protein